MQQISSLLCILLALSIASGQVNIYDPRVFNPSFYANTNPDLALAGITNITQLQSHWNTNGIAEGRQATSAFHTQQYLLRYADLMTACGTNYLCALTHYLQFGWSEHRCGYLEGGGMSHFTYRWTVASAGACGNSSGIWMSASNRTAGAIDSIFWNGLEFVNSFDHGRLLQVAIANISGEAWNPTQGGSAADAQGITSSSKMQTMTAGGSGIGSAAYAAFWKTSANGGIPNNTTSPYLISYNATIVNNMANFSYVNYTFSFIMPENQTYLQVEMPTGYVPSDFTKILYLDCINNINTLPPGNGLEFPGSKIKIIMATNDTSAAVGSVAVMYPATTNVPAISSSGWNFLNVGAIGDNNVKWTNAWRGHGLVQGQVLNFGTVICVGNLTSVVSCLSYFSGPVSVDC